MWCQGGTNSSERAINTLPNQTTKQPSNRSRELSSLKQDPESLERENDSAINHMSDRVAMLKKVGLGTLHSRNFASVKTHRVQFVLLMAGQYGPRNQSDTPREWRQR